MHGIAIAAMAMTENRTKGVSFLHFYDTYHLHLDRNLEFRGTTMMINDRTDECLKHDAKVLSSIIVQCILLSLYCIQKVCETTQLSPYIGHVCGHKRVSQCTQTISPVNGTTKPVHKHCDA